MKVLVVLGHPRVGSFCHAIATTAAQTLQEINHEVIYHDLYREKFDPLLPFEQIAKDAEIPAEIRRHCEQLQEVGGYVIVHPNWWGQPPAILKGWVDRVFRQGVAYDFTADGVKGLLAGKRALVFTTSNTPRDDELRLYGDPLENLWKNCIFGFCGLTNFRRRNFESIILSTHEQRVAWLEEVRLLVREMFVEEQVH
ncbi:MAG: NAD(P)H-dependent oxidoreductase [Thermogutta sp.]|uniref:NAD(P)H-dependent oxidoreductase n=1 Tax=Thermogutta sp. TaxID=1962930 RepID=UPI001991FD71|nr:NAD(P)H-dependent oxidoreductase [Thermogutta sp.]MBC7354200.1 NAD(P)H-dependent oxidoreductase [Thermogutta sp.]